MRNLHLRHLLLTLFCLWWLFFLLKLHFLSLISSLSLSSNSLFQHLFFLYAFAFFDEAAKNLHLLHLLHHSAFPFPQSFYCHTLPLSMLYLSLMNQWRICTCVIYHLFWFAYFSRWTFLSLFFSLSLSFNFSFLFTFLFLYTYYTFTFPFFYLSCTLIPSLSLSILITFHLFTILLS